ncbi:MAG: 1-phosphofructokinase family hexose kinase [Thermotogae bacterium]|nr:1-phosphofructokinase family hexose kinase [Thermotogota bacterium]
MEVLTVTLNPALDREIVLKNFRVNELHRLDSQEMSLMSPGGKGINVSVMLDDLGIPNIAMGFLGGYVGRIIEEELRKAHKNITTNFTYVDEESRENLTLIDKENETITEINMSGPKVSKENMDRFLKRYKQMLSHSKICVISGSIPPGVAKDVYKQLVLYAKEREVLTIINARDDLLSSALEAGPDVVKPDMRGEKTLLGHELNSIQDYIDSALEMRRMGVKLTVISHELSNDVVATEEGVWYFKPRLRIEAANLLGTGDAYIAGVVYYLYKGDKNWKEAAKVGMASAVRNALSIEKEVKIDIEEIKEELKNIEIERLR